MYQAIKNFNKQFGYEPKIKNKEELKKTDKFIVTGMGGSHLAADLLKIYNPYLNLIVHKNYGLPALSDNELRKKLIIVSSYSGNTEEEIDAFGVALSKGLSLAVISTGGKLIALAKKHIVPYIQMPDTNIRPRLALGFNLKSLLKMMGKENELKEIGGLVDLLNPIDYENSGRKLAEQLRGFVPIIYSSVCNQAIAYNWKIKFNETGKIPVFYNVFPELNHNEIAGFNVKESTKKLSRNFYFIFLKDRADNLKIQKRMEILEKLYMSKGLLVKIIELYGKNIFHKIFSSLILSDWAAYYTAKQYNLNPEQTPMIEEFKKLMRN